MMYYVAVCGLWLLDNNHSLLLVVTSLRFNKTIFVCSQDKHLFHLPSEGEFSLIDYHHCSPLYVSIMTQC